MKFTSVLIANRGEIAARILSTVQFMGLEAVCVYSETDAKAPYIALADKAVAIGPSDPAQSYLDADKLIEAALRTGAQAIHPGYGFLSENAGFAEQCYEAGLVFIGPRPETIALMADKAKARQAALAAKIPVIPGYHGTDQSFLAFKVAAKTIGLPLMIKAAHGGGGMGISRIDELGDLASAVKSAQAQAKTTFGNNLLILEKAIESARHIEVQILADRHGHIVHLGTRECSVQRRHQKLIEEAPAPGLDQEQTNTVCELAVHLAKTVGYVGAGTIEFLLDAEGQFYFLEINTRLQVEHSVTEAITGEDIVEQQIRIAQGEVLSLNQNSIKFYGHAIEARILAEDAENGFLPASGTVNVFAPDPMLRVDSGVEAGSKISPYYDPLLAKFIAQDDTREQARLTLLAGLKHSVILGLTHTMDFLKTILQDKDFIAGHITTEYVKTHLQGLLTNLQESSGQKERVPLACALKLRIEQERLRALSPYPALLSGWASATSPQIPVHLTLNAHTYKTVTVWTDRQTCRVDVDGNAHTVSIEMHGPHKALCTLDGVMRTVHFANPSPHGLHLHMDGDTSLIEFVEEGQHAGNAAQASGLVTAPMHGRIAEVFVKAGDKVEAGACLCVLEAMKMRHEICAPYSGIALESYALAGGQVAGGDKLFEIEATKTS